MVMKANADNEIIIHSLKDVTDKDGVETGELIVNGISVGFKEYTDIIPFKTSNLIMPFSA